MTDPVSIRVRVLRKTFEAEDICSFELASADGGELPPFEAGSHIDVHMPNGVVRQYSLCNRPGERHRYQIAVLRESAGRGGSAYMHDDLRESDMLAVGIPRNLFRLVPGAQRSVLLAGGIGVTPMLAMAERLDETGAEFEFHYATRSAARTAFAERIRTSNYQHRSRFYVGDASSYVKLELAKVLANPQPGTHLYACGPAGFLDAVQTAAAAANWHMDNVHQEHFAGSAPDASAQGFDVVIKSTGAVIRVEADKTVAQALEAHGVQIPLSCEQGVCGTCLTRVLEGEIDHKDQYLTPQEQAVDDQFLPCCSRAKSPRIVLDL